MKHIFLLFTSIVLLFTACTQNKTNNITEADIQRIADSLATCSTDDNPYANTKNYELSEGEIKSLADNIKKIDPNLPTIGILVYNGVLMTEVTAPVDVFSKYSEDGKQLFNVIIIAEKYNMLTCEEGLKIFPDYTFENAPDLNIIIVPSTYDMSEVVKNKNLVSFLQKQNEKTDYTVSNCAGAYLMGASGIADGKKIVTYIGGGKELQKIYPNLKVQDDSKVSYVEDGKFMSSNGNLATYISSLELLEKLSSKKHREYVESHLYIDRLRDWK